MTEPIDSEPSKGSEPPAMSSARQSRASLDARPVSFLTHVRAIAGKDLRIEWRSREILYTTLFLAALIVLVFSFAFISGADVNPGPGRHRGHPVGVDPVLGHRGPGPHVRPRAGERGHPIAAAVARCPAPAIYLGKLVATSVLMGAGAGGRGAAVRAAVQRRARPARRCTWR